LEKYPDSRHDRCNTEVGLLETGFVDVNRTKMAKNRVNMTAVVLEMLKPSCPSTKEQLSYVPMQILYIPIM